MSPVRLNHLPAPGLMVGATVFMIALLGVLAVPGIAGALTTVPASQTEGAKAIEVPGQVPFQESVTEIAPDPVGAFLDRARLAKDGCMAYKSQVTLPECAYGDLESDKRALLFGDSRAMQWFTPLLPLAERRGWRLTGLVRADCVIALVRSGGYCDRWRQNMVKRILTEERPDLVILGTATKALYRVWAGGRQLSRTRSQPLLVDGLVRLIRKFQDSGARVILMRDQMQFPFNPAECVPLNSEQLGECAIAPVPRRLPFDLIAAKKTGVRTIDPTPMLCSSVLCPAVIGDVLVYKDRYHLTATYAATLEDWLGPLVPRITG